MERREFLRRVGTAGLGSAVVGVSGARAAEPNAPAKQEAPVQVQKVPKRKLGRTGIEVPILALGFGGAGEPAVLRQSLDWGVNHWDTSFVAAGGNSEATIGKFLADNPQLRKDIIIVTKAEQKARTAAEMEKCLETSLKRLNTSYADVYLGIYIMNDPAELTDEAKNWAKSAKDRGLIKFFGFSTHANIEKCLSAAAKTDWIDAVQVKCSFRELQNAQMQEAVDACYKAGVGIIAMKTQGKPVETEDEKKIVAHFLQKGFTEGQAKIKAVLQDERISTACVNMGSTAMLMTNVAAVLDKTKLAQDDLQILKEYAAATCSGYCAGCAEICEAVTGAPVSDIMRYLMYHNSYGDTQRARDLFAQIPVQTRSRLLSIDYAAAEARCPQRMPIGKLVAEAVTRLA